MQAAPTWEALLPIANDWAADVVHVDDYEAPSDLRDRLAAAGLLLSNVEDGVWGRRAADVVVDPTLGAERTPRPVDGSGRVVRGGRQVLVRGSVRRARVRRSARGAVDRTPEVVVVMGGTDVRGILGPAVGAVVAAGLPVRLLAVGPAGTDLAMLGVAASAGAEIVVSGPRADLPDVMAGADLVVTAAGTTVWELCCMGVPMAVVPVVDNQRPVHDALVAAGAAVGLGGPEQLADVAPARIAGLLEDRSGRDAMGRTALEVVDGLGTARLLAVLEDVVRDPGRAPAAGRTAVGMRPAVPADAVTLLEWRNDPATRRSSRHAEVVDRAEHDRWLESSLQSTDRHLLVAEDAAATPIGTVRWDAQPGQPGAWEVSITLAPDQRGRGMALPVLHAAERWLVTRESEARHLLACVHTGNVASSRLFGRAGYAPDRAADATGFARYRRVLAPDGA